MLWIAANQMQIQVNGTPQTVAEGLTLAGLVSALELSERRIAVEVNEELVPRTVHGERVLQPGDRVEIVQAIGGG